MIVETVGDGFDGERSRSCRGQLDSEGHPVEMPADAHHPYDIHVVDFERGVCMCRTFLEQLDGLVLQRSCRLWPTVVWQPHSWDLVDGLAGQSQWLTAGGKDLQLGRRLK